MFHTKPAHVTSCHHLHDQICHLYNPGKRKLESTKIVWRPVTVLPYRPSRKSVNYPWIQTRWPASVRHIATRLPCCHNSRFTFTAIHLAPSTCSVFLRLGNAGHSPLFPHLSVQIIKWLKISVHQYGVTPVYIVWLFTVFSFNTYRTSVNVGRDSDSLRAGRSGDRIPVEARFSAPVQTGPGAYPASCTMVTGSFRGVKRPERGVDHPPPSSPEVKERVELYLYSPSGPSWHVLGWTFMRYVQNMTLGSSSHTFYNKVTLTKTNRPPKHTTSSQTGNLLTCESRQMVIASKTGRSVSTRSHVSCSLASIVVFIEDRNWIWRQTDRQTDGRTATQCTLSWDFTNKQSAACRRDDVLGPTKRRFIVY
jgi:hypothetical protein